MKGRILILEDEAVVAMDIAAELEDDDWEVVGPAGALDKAEALARTEHLDAALLDINLSGANSFDLAARLRQDGVRVVFLTGYSAETLPETLSDCIVVSKPVIMSQLLSALNRELQR